MSDLSFINPPRTILQAYRSLPEGTMAQLIQNQIIRSPSPLDRHQRISLELSSELFFMLKEKSWELFAMPLTMFILMIRMLFSRIFFL
mgnify:CR=1 FL=1